MSDPIVGIATAAGEGGIAVVRISGDGAADLFQQVFRPAGKRRRHREEKIIPATQETNNSENIDRPAGDGKEAAEK